MQPLLVLTIGQTPRDDLVAELVDAMGPDARAAERIEVRGALDGMTPAEIETIGPVADTDALHVRLPGDLDVIISKKAVTQRMAPLVAEAKNRLTVVACTGRFQGLPERPNLLFPSVVLDGLIDAILPAGYRLGVLVPIPEQIELFADLRGRADRPATVTSVKPGTDPSEAATELRKAGVDLVVLDCFGYDRTLLARVREVTGVPVISAARATALLAAELMG
ncbi:MAG: AroM family protein [Actinomycetia bacterium]|nr:AroM family protein [Actinomycetes bacterium]MCP4221782.1 AroM family protein [Actinomycetes bacterium]MCP5032688.1 AroM family protein [Actinomycetes bacterium]